MSNTQCRYPGCLEPAKAKCGICGEVYCILHIQCTGPIGTCDVCIAKIIKAEKEKAAQEKTVKQAAMAEAQAKQAADRLEREAWKWDDDGYHSKCIALYELGRYVETIIACEHTIKINPSHDFAYDYKSKALEHLGRYREAQEAHEAAQRLRGKR